MSLRALTQEARVTLENSVTATNPVVRSILLRKTALLLARAEQRVAPSVIAIELGSTNQGEKSEKR
jgi:hypothetical protein